MTVHVIARLTIDEAEHREVVRHREAGTTLHSIVVVERPDS